METKYCKDCVHFEVCNAGKEQHVCAKSHRIENDLVTGPRPAFSWCKNMRLPGAACGPDGAMFESKPAPPERRVLTGTEVIRCYPAYTEEAVGYGEILKRANAIGMTKNMFDRWRESLFDDGMLMRRGKGYKRTFSGDNLANPPDTSKCADCAHLRWRNYAFNDGTCHREDLCANSVIQVGGKEDFATTAQARRGLCGPDAIWFKERPQPTPAQP